MTQKAWRATDVPDDPICPRLGHLLTGGGGLCKSKKIRSRAKFYWPPLTLATNLSRAIFKVPRAIFGPRAAIWEALVYIYTCMYSTACRVHNKAAIRQILKSNLWLSITEYYSEINNIIRQNTWNRPLLNLSDGSAKTPTSVNLSDGSAISMLNHLQDKNTGIIIVTN
jgi:hypothetical protein